MNWVRRLCRYVDLRDMLTFDVRRALHARLFVGIVPSIRRPCQVDYGTTRFSASQVAARRALHARLFAGAFHLVRRSNLVYYAMTDPPPH